MKIVYLLHFYQPDFQFKEVLEEVYTNSYSKIFKIVENSPHAKIVINITSSTIELFNNNYHVGNIIEDLKRLYKLGKVEFTATSLAHVLLSHSTLNQALRQVDLDVGKKSWYLGIPKEEFKILFPPEVSVNDQVFQVARNSNLEGLIVPHSIFKNFSENRNELIKKDLKVFVRSLKLSRMFESPEVTSLIKLRGLLDKSDLDKNKTYIVAHDAEILGYQNKDESKMNFFEQLLNSDEFQFTTFKEELKVSNFKKDRSKIYAGTWEKLLINDEWIDVHWKNKKNQIHKYQWKMSELIVKTIEKLPDVNKKFDLQTHLDYCQYSCQYWWASSFPFWSTGIISHAAWTWLYLAYRVYNELVLIDKDRAISFIGRIEKYHMNINKHLAQYDLSKWHEKNISYYDNFIHPLKLKFEL